MPSSRDLPNPGIEPGSPTSQADSLPSEPPESNGSIPPNSSIPAMISGRAGISPLLPSRKLLLDGSSCHVSHQLWFLGGLEGLGQVQFRGEPFWRTVTPLITWSRLIRR